MGRHLPLLYTVAPVGMPGDELGGGLFGCHAGGGLIVQIGALKDQEARNLAHSAFLHQLLRQVALLDEVGVLHFYRFQW